MQNQQRERIVVCITGMPGAGKSTVADVAVKEGFEIFRMGDDVRMEAEKRGVQPTDENLGAIMLDLRQKGGAAAIAHLCAERIRRTSTSHFIVIDGVRNMNEFFEFRKLGTSYLIGVHTSPSKRYDFLQSRKRSDSPSSIQTFEARDRRELTVGVGEAIAMSDELIVNSGTVDDLKERASGIFKRLKEQG